VVVCPGLLQKEQVSAFPGHDFELWLLVYLVGSGLSVLEGGSVLAAGWLVSSPSLA